MIYKATVLLATILAGGALNATETAEPAASHAPIELEQTRHTVGELERVSSTVVASVPPLSLTLAQIEPTAPEMILTLEKFEFDFTDHL